MKRFLAIILSARVLLATSYYVDFTSGSDSNTGTSTNTAWKHCPGDANASGNAAITPAAGDTFTFRGGVRYQGHIIVNGNGTAGNPIAYYGNRWGESPAIIDGSETLTKTWTNCTGLADCWTNANWSNIWRTSLPTNGIEGGTISAFTQLSVSDAFLPWSQEPDPTNYLFWESVTSWFPVAPTNVTKTNLTDTYFSQAGASYWTNAYISVWVQGNHLATMPIAGFDPATHKVSFSMGVNDDPYTDRTSYWKVMNHPMLIDSPGEYAWSSDGRLYYWPRNNEDPNAQTIQVSTREIGFEGQSKAGIKVEGFKIVNTCGAFGGANYAGGSGIYYGNGASFTAISNEVTNVRSFAGAGGIYLELNTNIVAIGNSIHDNSWACRGLIISAITAGATNNSIYNLQGTGLYFAGVTNGTISSNSVTRIYGTHANGMSVYQQSRNVLIERNSIIDAGTDLITYENSSDLTFQNNLVDGADAGQINEWGGCAGYVRWFNNTLVRGLLDRMLSIGLSGTNCSYTLINNIIDGGGPDPATNPSRVTQTNIYTGLAYWNTSFGTGEVVQTNQSLIFIAPGTDWKPLIGGTAYHAGADLSAYLTTDASGIERPPWSIGAIENSLSSTMIYARPIRRRR